jgi:hypothetical protein
LPSPSVDDRQSARDTAHGNTSGIPVFHTALQDVSAEDHDIEPLILQATQHINEEPLVVLKIGIHHYDKGCRGGQDAFHAGACEAAPSSSSNDPYPTIPRFWSQVQQSYANPDLHVFAKLFEDCLKGLLKPRHFLGVRLAVMTMSWISSSDILSMSV